MKLHRLLLVAAMVLSASVGPADTRGEINLARLASTGRADLPVQGQLPSFQGASAWLNSQPLSPRDLRGKVVLVEFWTYTCINWRRTLPYVRTWAQTYKDRGLVVIGVHTPEFSFEKDLDNVRAAAKEEDVDYPIAVDTRYAIWNAFANQYWPALYIVDSKGRIRYHQFGEGGYEESERVIQQLLAEAGYSSPVISATTVEGQGAEAAPDWSSLRTPETYVGYASAQGFASPGGAVRGRGHLYTSPAVLRPNSWSLTGRWTIKNEFAVSEDANGRIAYRFHARDVHLVMGPTKLGTPIRFRVSIEGHPPGDSHGVDVSAEGEGRIDAPRMYQLIRQRAPIEDRELEIEFVDPGAEVYVFTFG